MTNPLNVESSKERTVIASRVARVVAAGVTVDALCDIADTLSVPVEVFLIGDPNE